MAINRINETDLQGKLVSQLSNRPTDPRSAGGDNMTAQEVKARHDALGLLVKDKLNEFIDALNNATVNGEPVTPLSDLITVVADNVSKSLTEWIEAKLTKNATAGDGVHAYGVDNAGEQTMLSVKDTPTAGAIPQYGTGGVLPVSDGTADGHAVAKGQMATAISSAINDLSTTLTALINAKYTKPDGGIPKADLSSEVKSILENAEKVLTAANYSAVATMLNAAAKTDYKVGQKILIGAGRVPDVWIYFVHDSAVSYTYTTDLAFQTALENGTLQIGYYALRPLEAKTELEDYPTKTEMNSAISGNIDATLSTTGKSADAKAVGDAIDALIDALVDGVMAVAEATYAESATYAQQADLANQINTDREIEDADTSCPPTVFGTVGGNAEVQRGLMKFPELRGHTIKWNQLINPSDIPATDTKNGITFTNNGDGSVTVSGTASDSAYINVSGTRTWIVGHKYLIKGCPSGGNGLSSYTLWQNQESKMDNGSGVLYTATKTNGSIMIRVASGTAISTPIVFRPNVFDVTETDYTTVAEFVRDFPMPYYAYNAGTLLSSKSSSVDFVKRNQWDEQWEQGDIVSVTGQPVPSSSYIRSKNFTRVLPSTTYFGSVGTGRLWVFYYDNQFNYISYTAGGFANTTFTTPSNCTFIKIGHEGTTYNHDICIYINWETPNLPYVAYSKQTITLPNIKLQSVGDVYDVAYQTGGGKRRIGERAYQSGDENDPDVLTDGTTTLYVLAAEIDITITENPGWDEFADIDNFGTVKFNQSPAQTIPVPQAYFVRYTVNLVEFLDSLYVHCGGDVSKLALVE